jgi:hypothetical protein
MNGSRWPASWLSFWGIKNVVGKSIFYFAGLLGFCRKRLFHHLPHPLLANKKETLVFCVKDRLLNIPTTINFVAFYRDSPFFTQLSPFLAKQ